MKAHKGHQKTFEIGKNMRERERERERQYLWNPRDLSEKKNKFLRRESGNWDERKACKNKGSLVIGDYNFWEKNIKYFEEEGDGNFLKGRWKFWRSG